jgi:hypothetical protein
VPQWKEQRVMANKGVYIKKRTIKRTQKYSQSKTEIKGNVL